MIAILKIAGLSAAISAGFVSAMDLRAPEAGLPVSGKLYTERAPSDDAPRPLIHLAGSLDRSAEPTDAREGRGDRLASGCVGQTWPYIARDCIEAGEGAPVRKVVRTITTEQRTGDQTSSLVRMPVTASR